MINSEYASAEILTGQMHLYRGVLNDKGKAYLKLFKVCTAKLMASGRRMLEKEAVDGVREFEEEIDLWRDAAVCMRSGERQQRRAGSSPPDRLELSLNFCRRRANCWTVLR